MQPTPVAPEDRRARRALPVPSARLQGACCAWLVLALAAIEIVPLEGLWQGAGVLLGLCCLADLWLGHRQGCPIAIRRRMPRSWPLGVSQTVALDLTHLRRAGRLCGALFDGVPTGFAFSGFPYRFDFDGGDRHELHYRATAQARGPHRFGCVEVLLDAPLGLWRWRHCLATDADEALVRVFPNFARVTQYTLLATDNRLSQIGLLRRRRRGEGLEFQELREYREGDALRQIDWKASARQGKLISRDYQDERNQQLLFVLDCGVRMRTREGHPGSADARADAAEGPGLSHFDYTLNAMLLLSYVALRQGDGVGLATFAHPEPRFIAPRRSHTALNHLLDAVYDLEPTDRMPDFLAAARLLAERVRKRSLIVFLTNLRDEDDDTLMPALALLRRRHVVVLASLQEPGLGALRARPVESFEDALAYAAASEYLSARQRSMAILRKNGVYCLDAAPAELPIGLVNQYWSMKRSGVL